MLLFTLNLADSGVVVETPAAAGYSRPRKKRFYAEVGGLRMLFPTAEAAKRAQEAADPKQVAAEVIKKAAVRKAPEPVKVAAPVVIEDDDEEDIEMLLLAL